MFYDLSHRIHHHQTNHHLGEYVWNFFPRIVSEQRGTTSTRAMSLVHELVSIRCFAGRFDARPVMATSREFHGFSRIAWALKTYLGLLHVSVARTAGRFVKEPGTGMELHHRSLHAWHPAKTLSTIILVPRAGCVESLGLDLHGDSNAMQIQAFGGFLVFEVI